MQLNPHKVADPRHFCHGFLRFGAEYGGKSAQRFFGENDGWVRQKLDNLPSLSRERYPHNLRRDWRKCCHELTKYSINVNIWNINPGKVLGNAKICTSWYNFYLFLCCKYHSYYVKIYMIGCVDRRVV